MWLFSLLNNLFFLIVVLAILALLLWRRRFIAGMVLGSIIASLKIGNILVMDILIYDVQAHPTLATAKAGEAVAEFDGEPWWLYLPILLVCVPVAFYLDRQRRRSQRAAALLDDDDD